MRKMMEEVESLKAKTAAMTNNISSIGKNASLLTNPSREREAVGSRGAAHRSNQ
jgi:uncharacterized membrane protein YoaK (UPF0700 family)